MSMDTITDPNQMQFNFQAAEAQAAEAQAAQTANSQAAANGHQLTGVPAGEASNGSSPAETRIISDADRSGLQDLVANLESGQVPEELTKRDWSDSKAEHDAKVEERAAKALAEAKARLERHERAQEGANWKEGVRRYNSRDKQRRYRERADEIRATKSEEEAAKAAEKADWKARMGVGLVKDTEDKVRTTQAFKDAPSKLFGAEKTETPAEEQDLAARAATESITQTFEPEVELPETPEVTAEVPESEQPTTEIPVEAPDFMEQMIQADAGYQEALSKLHNIVNARLNNDQDLGVGNFTGAVENAYAALQHYFDVAQLSDDDKAKRLDYLADIVDNQTKRLNDYQARLEAAKPGVDDQTELDQFDDFDETEEVQATDTTDVVDVEGEEVDVPQTQAARNRIKNLFRRAKKALRNPAAWASTVAGNRARATSEYFQDEEKGRRRIVVGTVVGAIAVGVGVYLATKGFHLPGSKGSGHEMLSTRPSGRGGDNAQFIHDVVPGKSQGNVVQQAHEQLGAHRGNWHDTIWNHAQQRNPKDPVGEMNRILNLNGITSEQAKHLPEGFDFMV